ncbi:MAG: SDR family oxidoreductase [Burkholderiales bacterium]|nr:SDR family oxidoreductase [Burkholderiales bacterium]
MFVKELLAGHRILVTGGGTGLGRAMTEKFLELGADAVICGRRGAVLDEAARALQDRYGRRVDTYAIDIRQAPAVEEMVEDIFARGGLTGLVNNAAGNFISRTEDLSPRGFDAIANIVMHGTFYVTHAVGRRWIEEVKARGGWQPGMPMKSVMSIIVTWVLNGGPFVVPSAMSKSAIHGMTMSLAAEWGRYGIRINAVGPGEIPTEGMSKRLNPGETPGARSAKLNPQARAGEMSELQNLAAFLMSGGCDWLSGQSIMMDGAAHLGTGGNFYELRHWQDADWHEARAAIEAQNARDRAQRS